jgi:tRNA nucleotidyltransferase (CCA-adding enzyme)
VVVTDFPEGDWLLGRAEALSVQDNAPKPMLLGRHMIALGAQPGKHFGALLDRCYEAQLDGLFRDEVEGLRYLQKLLNELESTEA